MPTPNRFDENAVQSVLARAVELEREHGSALTEAQVRAIADELSIPGAAVDEALAEHRSNASGREAGPAPSRSWRSGTVVAMTVAIILVGLLLLLLSARGHPA
jgi:hypothetical protein